MDFDDLIGKEFEFFGVDHNNFKIGDMVWKAEEDECDGWRSCLGAVEQGSFDGLIFFYKPVATVRVEYIDSEPDDGWGYHHGQFYRLVDVNTGHVWLKFGTGDYDDYYPYFVFDYEPAPNGLNIIL